MQGGKLTNEETGIEWLPWKGEKYSLKWTQMKVRPHYSEWVERSAVMDVTGWWRWRAQIPQLVSSPPLSLLT